MVLVIQSGLGSSAMQIVEAPQSRDQHDIPPDCLENLYARWKSSTPLVSNECGLSNNAETPFGGD